MPPSATPRPSSSRPMLQTADEMFPLPTYKSNDFPLSDASRGTIERLISRYPFAELQKTLEDCVSSLTNSVGEINDQLHEREADLAKRKRLRVRDYDERGMEPDPDFEAAEDDLKTWARDNTGKVSKRLEASVRQALDGQESIVSTKRVLGELNGEALQNVSQRSGLTQSTAHITQPGSTGIEDQELVDLMPTLENKIDAARERYEYKSMRQKYSDNTQYQVFKRTAHDAMTQGQGESLPAPRFWFSIEEGGSPPPGVNRGGADNDSDDDVAISRVNVSTVCPITFLPYVTPVTSRKCPHSFEKTAIFNMIRQQPRQIQLPRSRGMQNVRQEITCPVSGCEETLGIDDLEDDPILIRKIKRVQRAKQLREEQLADGDEDDNGPGRRRQMQEISDGEGGPDADDIDEITATQAQQRRRVKQEKGLQNDDIEDVTEDEGNQ